MADKEFIRNLWETISNPDYILFDLFLIKKMLPQLQDLPGDEITEEIRWQAYHECMRLMGDRRPAAVQTVQHWFGIHRYTSPSREMMFQIGFALGLTVEEMEVYLKEGLGETGFQMSDYSEVVYCYCLRNGYSWDEAQEMIHAFELGMPLNVEVHHNNFTNHLWMLFQEKMDLPPREFVKWMERYGSYLKGYSMTSLHYLKLLRGEILNEIRWDAKSRLEELMEETGYSRWVGQRGRSMVKRELSIARFLESSIAQKDISQELKSNISEMLKLTHLAKDANERLLMDVYASAWEQDILSKKKRKTVQEKLHLKIMDAKYISELFSVGLQKERQLQLLSLRVHLLELEGENCPAGLWKKAVELEYPGEKKAGDMIEWVTKAVSYQSQRCRMIQRSDLLVLAFHLVSLHQMQKTQGGGMGKYYNRAREELLDVVDPMMTACNMEKFHPEKYMLDAVLWSCFSEDETYSLSDVIDILGEG